jgi:hypothetical protein
VSDPVPTVAEVEAIAALDDPVLRNLRITQGYHELSRAVARRVAPAGGANWCSFATWASRQAGQTIRGEDLADAVDDVFGAPEVRELLERVVRLAAAGLRGATPAALATAIRRVIDPERALRRAADAVAAGNLKVFAEIGREFARWLATAAADGAPDAAPDAAATAAFCDALRPGEPPDGQRLLREAFAAYGDACAATDAEARAERLLLANLLVGLHEQTRLQPEIRASLDASIDGEEVRGALLSLLLPGVWLRRRAALARRLGRPLPLDVAIDALVSAVRRRLRLVITEHLMTLRLPGTPPTVLRLGHDLRDAFPEALARVDHPALHALLARVDPTPDSTTGSGATDWAELPERMHFIADFFRSWHARTGLHDPPYDAAQVAAMRAGRVPAGPL